MLFRNAADRYVVRDGMWRRHDSMTVAIFQSECLLSIMVNYPFGSGTDFSTSWSDTGQ
jgi:hypothetical protein